MEHLGIGGEGPLFFVLSRGLSDFLLAVMATPCSFLLMTMVLLIFVADGCIRQNMYR
jgi:hypothetical protein